MQTASPPESLTGLIERVTFFNEESGFSVLRVKAKGRAEEVTVVGSLPSANAGEWVTAEGTWIRDREFGLQFKAHLLTSTPPTSREGIEKYLGSGLVKGIGPVYAKKLVAKFGEDIFDIIENTSARLEEVEGIGPKRRRVIKDAWAEQKAIRKIMVFLHSHGVSTSRAVRIYKTYGDEAVERVQSDPYTLSRDIPGIGFKTADKIAQNSGIPRDSVLRASAGMEHVLREASAQGHCALPMELLVDETTKILGIERSIADAAFERNLQQQFLVRDRIAGEEFAFLPPLKRAEESVASVILRLANSPATYPQMDFGRAVAWCEQKSGKQLAPSQREALRMAMTHRLLVVTGGPGVGKTTLVNAILLVLKAKNVRCTLCAPTGRAAKRLSESTGLPAKTIHRLLEADGRAGGFTRNERRPIDCDLLVVDETSMVDIALMSSLLRALPSHGSLLLVGDVDQLPSVGPGMVLRDMIESGVAPVARLTEVFRQAMGSRIITNAHRINTGLLPELPDKNAASDFYFIEREDPEAIARFVVDLVKNRIPKKFGIESGSIQVLCPMHRGALGVRELNGRLQEALNPRRPDESVVDKFGWQFRRGDRVIQTENDYDKEVFNGDIGQVVSIDGEEKELTVSFDQRDVVYQFGELDELSPAYAITIHKSQGSEFPAVVIPVATQHYMLLQRNLIYTGVTRGKKLVVLAGQAKALGIAVRNNRTEQRYSGLRQRLTTAMSEP